MRGPVVEMGFVAGEDEDKGFQGARRNMSPPILEILVENNAPKQTLLPVSWRRSTAALVASGLVRRAARNECIVVCVCGGAGGGNGKNVYTRFLVNSVLLSSGAEVAVIDGDCVHPEFALPGTVSLAVLRQPLAAPGAAYFSSEGTCRQDAVTPLKSFFVGSQKVPPVSVFLVTSRHPLQPRSVLTPFRFILFFAG